jgi:hypothetical protein
MACERLTIGVGCRRIVPRPLRRPWPLIEIGEDNSLRRELSAGYSEDRECGSSDMARKTMPQHGRDNTLQLLNFAEFTF